MPEHTSDPGAGSGPGTRGHAAMRRSVVGAFAAVLAGLLGLGLVAALGLRSSAREAGRIAGDYALSVEALASLRGAVGAIRGAAPGVRAGEASARQIVASAREAARASFRRYTETPAGHDEEALRAELRRELGRLDALAATALEPGAAAAPEWSEALRGAALRIDELAERLVRQNGEAARSASVRIDASLRRIGWTTAALAGLGGLAAVILLLVALHAVERYAAEADLRAQEMEAFAARVAHDIRTPLQTIRLSVELVGRAAGDAQVLETCRRAERNVVRLGRFIDDLLEFSRAGARPRPGAAADVTEVLDGLRDELAARAAEGGVALEISADPGLAAAMAPGALRAVAVNLAENALKYLGDAAERRVEVGARGEGGEVLLSVRDTGPGIPAEALPHLFDLHFRGARQTAGYGIGLATVRRLAEAHGGRVAVETEPGRGTTFTVTLPRARPAVAPTS
ncbi:MAG TPA: HAMP domain-containing sensor histidine kinase [Anaeromyxobacteraceae bacterium]|nr:HAMP domain-containing sensor histidine kinase [Anaeromyxobacteraceae bacterium]